SERAPKYYRDSDIDILGELSKRPGGYGYHGSRPRSLKLVQRIIATGRACWRDHKGPPLRWGEPRQGRIEWRQLGEQGVSPRVPAADAIAVMAERRVYVDEGAGVTGPVDLSLPPRLAYQLLSAPTIPRAQVSEVARRLGERLPELHPGLLPGTPAAAVKIE